MSKAVLISVQPKWCELIASGKKTVEVRKTRPRVDTPFKCYIYCTKPKKILRYVWGKEDYAGYGEPYTQMRDDEKVFCKIPDGSSAFCSPPYSGKVIGEFVCDKIDEYARYGYAGVLPRYMKKSPGGYPATEIHYFALQLNPADMDDYGKGKLLYGWHISDLVIYDKPKELGEYRHRGDNYHFKPPITRPPQSWCYAEELV